MPPRGCQLAGMKPGPGSAINPFSIPLTSVVAAPPASGTLMILLPTEPSRAAGPTPSSSQNREPPATARADTLMTPFAVVAIDLAVPPPFGTWRIEKLHGGLQVEGAVPSQ